MLQLENCRQCPEVLEPGTLDAIEALNRVGVLSSDDAEFLKQQYRFLRSVESGLRLMNTTARHDLPEDKVQLQRLAYLLNEPGGSELASSVSEIRKQVRSKSELLFESASSEVDSE